MRWDGCSTPFPLRQLVRLLRFEDIGQRDGKADLRLIPKIGGDGVSDPGLVCLLKALHKFLQLIGRDRHEHLMILAGRPDPVAVAGRLSPLLGTEPGRLVSRLSRDLPFAWLARQIPLDTTRKIRAMGLRGIGTETEGKRYYPNRELAGHVLGFTGVDSQGLEGLEWAFDSHLTGPEERLLLQRDARGRVLWQEVPERRGRRGCCRLEEGPTTIRSVGWQARSARNVRTHWSLWLWRDAENLLG